jgi:cytochrome c oxidase cbb3-type subunit 3
MPFGWTLFVTFLVAVNVIGAGWLMRWSATMGGGDDKATTGHTWDGDLVEGNKPLPRWWLNLFWLTIIWGVLFMIAMPSIGNFSLLGWTQQSQYDEEVRVAEERFGGLFAKYAATPIPDLAKNARALSAGRNLFVNNCAGCHGSDARGARGFPNLTDAEWNWGGAPEQIKQTIMGGRTGVMPSFAALPDETRQALVQYVLKLAGRGGDPKLVDAGQQAFNTNCAACHGPTGTGNIFLGAPNLTNDSWLHGSGATVLYDVITNGRTNQMPAHEPILGADRAHVLAAYVLSLSQQQGR